jgi:hypothetical protein
MHIANKNVTSTTTNGKSYEDNVYNTIKTYAWNDAFILVTVFKVVKPLTFNYTMNVTYFMKVI